MLNLHEAVPTATPRQLAQFVRSAANVMTCEMIMMLERAEERLALLELLGKSVLEHFDFMMFWPA